MVYMQNAYPMRPAHENKITSLLKHLQKLEYCKVTVPDLVPHGRCTKFQLV